MKGMDGMDDFESSDVRVRWRWELPPFRAYWRTTKGDERSVARWTPGAARLRAYELQHRELVLRLMARYREGRRP